MKIALIIGATGLIGKQLLHLLLDDPEYHQVKVVTRKKMDLTHAKLQNFVGDLETLEQIQSELKADDIFCCLGTTMKTAGSKEAFEKVDYEYPLAIAKIGKASGAKQYFLVSALGADKNSSIYYNKVKGKIEAAIAEQNFSALHIFRPSLLLGDRKENRAGEEAAKVFYKVFGFLFPRKYKAIESGKVAKAMHYFARQEYEGMCIHESGELQTY